MKVKLTNLDKVFWPKEGYTKGDVINYYDKISNYILPYLKDKPESLYRQPHGIDGGFFQKNFKEESLPEFVKSALIKSKHLGKDINFILCQNKETLLYMANLGCIEINPWLSRVKSIDKPDFMLIDLDPGDDIGFECVVEVALSAHKILDEIDAPNFCKTSGKTGLHIIVPLGARYSYEQVKQFAELIAILINKEKPKFTSLERSPAKRKDKIYLDFLQNRIGQTITAPYSLRPWPKATVSTPLLWKEVKKNLKIADYNINNIFERLEKLGDIWQEVNSYTADINKCLKKLRFYK